MVLTTGLVRRLSDDELDAVICHELGHIHHRDVVLMTLLSLIPAMCYFAARALMTMDDDSDDDEGDLLIFVLGFLVLYAVTELLLLAVSRSREYDADRWAFDQMGNAEPLVSALIVVTHAADEATAAVERRCDEVAACDARSANTHGVQLPTGGVDVDGACPRPCLSDPHRFER